MKLINKLTVLFLICGVALGQQTTPEPFKPTVGQAGKDVVWVPTPQGTVDKMLEVAKVTPEDYVIDLGSGDGRNVITAARLGARALGVEWNQDMVDLSKRLAAEAGVSAKAQFLQGDMYAADISQASVMALFLLVENMQKLMPKFLALRPGSRIVSNTFGFGDQGWEPDSTETLRDCSSWCTIHLWIVPADVAGSWQLPQGTLTLTQKFQNVTGTLGAAAISNGKLRGNELSFTVNQTPYVARVNGEVMEENSSSPRWRATRTSRPAAAAAQQR
ncbi:MAG TPA: class I SAM-dependent methyltransferase [Terriglobia bacterium]|nr:class I SAM-dependent methyltransferase [Terriglobia bacterium]